MVVKDIISTSSEFAVMQREVVADIFVYKTVVARMEYSDHIVNNDLNFFLLPGLHNILPADRF